MNMMMMTIARMKQQIEMMIKIEIKQKEDDIKKKQNDMKQKQNEIKQKQIEVKKKQK